MATTVLIKEIQNGDKLTLEKLKKKIKDDLCFTPIRYFKTLSKYACLLPSLQHFPQDFIQEINQKTLLLDNQIQNVLEESRSINWCPEVTKFYALSAKGDGNCLAHAVSLALWSIDDSDLILRKLIYEEITTDRLQTFKQRWKRYCCIQAEEIGGVLLSSTDWNSEWTNEVELACCTKQDDIFNNLLYGSLGDIHTFILANIIRRPIIVIGEDVIRNFDGNTLASNKLVGVYLPLLWKPEECVHNPILLGYDQNHYVPLVTTEIDMVLTVSHNIRAIPLVKVDLTPLTPHLLTYDEENNIDTLYRNYFQLIEVPYIKDGEHICILAAKLCEETLPEDLNLMDAFFKKNERIYRNLLEAGSSSFEDIVGKEVKQSDESKDLRKASLSLSPSRQMANPTEKLQKLLVRKTSDQMNQEEFSEVFNTSVGPITCNYQKCITEYCPNFQSFYTMPYCHECNNSKAVDVGVPKNPLLRTYSEGSSKNSPTQQDRKKGIFNFNTNSEMSERIYKGYNQIPHLGKVLETKLDVLPTKIKAISEEQLPCTSFFFCKTVDCTFGTNTENDIYCSQCSKLNAQNKSSRTSQNPPDEHSLPRLSLLDPFNPEPPADTSIKYLCVTPGCDGLRSPNVLGLCYYCYKKTVKSCRKVSPSSSRPKLKRRLSKCIFPCCTNCTFSESFVCQQCYNLCCLIMDPSFTTSNQSPPKDKMRLTSQVSPGLDDPTLTLRQQKAATYPPQRSFQNDLTAGGNNRLEKGEPCLNPSCTLFGRPETLHFCSQCFYKYLEDQTYSSTFKLARNKPDVIYIQRKNLSDPPASFVFSDPVQKSTPLSSCVADAGCRNVGNLETQGLCASCYEKFLKLTLPKKEGSEFLLHLIQDCVKQDTGKCLSAFCNNRGNRKCNGYCNNCNYHTFASLY